MSWLMTAGGAPMWFIAIFGVVALAVSARFVMCPNAQRLGLIRGLWLATLFSIGAGVTADLAAVMMHVANKPEFANSPHVHLTVMTGIGESMAPAILGFSLLSLSAFLTAIGSRRMPQ